MAGNINGHPDYFKDNRTGVIRNTSDAARRSYREKKQQAMRQVESQYEIQSLKSELSEVKELLHQLLKNNGT